MLQQLNFNFMNLFTYGDNSIRSDFACDVNNSRDRVAEHTNLVKKFTFVGACALVTVLMKCHFWFLHCSSWIQSTVNFSNAPRLYSRPRQQAVP